MLTPLDRIKVLYSKIINDALESENNGCTTYIFVSNDTDSLCAMRILTTILKSDEVQFVIIPVFSIVQLDQELKRLEQFKDALRSLIFLNCGGSSIMAGYWFYPDQTDDQPKVTAYIFDSHRPFYHGNVNDSSKCIQSVDDSCKSFAECPTEEDMLEYEELMQEAQSDQDSDLDESDNIDGENGQEGSELNVANEQIDLAELQEQEEIRQELADLKDSDEEEMYSGLKKADSPQIGIKRDRDPAEAQALTKIDKGRLKRHRRAQYENYYKGTFYGKPTASIMYELSVQLNKDCKEMLWWRIIGVTSQHIHERLDETLSYHEMYGCNNEVSRLLPKQIEDKAEMEESKDQKDLFKLDYQTHNREVGHIKAESELKFMLLRHWTLFDSINNSTYMMAKLNLWKEPGQKALRDFLLQIGIPLDQAKQKFNFMDPALKNDLTDRIRKKAETFGLGDILQHSFVRQYDTKTQFSSHDMAFAISSLLEHPNISGEAAQNENKSPNFTALKEQTQNVTTAREQLLVNFWVAYDALEQNSHSKLSLIYKGIEQTKEMQQAIMRVGNAILDQREVKQMKQFNYVFIENTFLKDILLFQYPLALSKLGVFILQARKARLKSEKAQKPLILSVKNTEKKRTLVIAVFGPEQANQVNAFGNYFSKTARSLNIAITHDSFDTAIVELKPSDWINFITQLGEQTQ